MRDRLSSLGDDDFFALADAIEQLGNIGSGFGEGDVGDHSDRGLTIGISIINRGQRCRVTTCMSRGDLLLLQLFLCPLAKSIVRVILGTIVGKRY
jgi:hypothetical protein